MLETKSHATLSAALPSEQGALWNERRRPSAHTAQSCALQPLARVKGDMFWQAAQGPVHKAQRSQGAGGPSRRALRVHHGPKMRVQTPNGTLASMQVVMRAWPLRPQIGRCARIARAQKAHQGIPGETGPRWAEPSRRGA